jgi:hypothetical protein
MVSVPVASEITTDATGCAMAKELQRQKAKKSIAGKGFFIRAILSMLKD